MGSKLWRKKRDSRRLGVILRFFGAFWMVLGPWESSANGVYFQQPMLIFRGNQQPTYKQLHVDSQEPGQYYESHGMLQPTFLFRPCCTGGKNLCARGSLFGEWRLLFAKLYGGTLI